MRDPANCGSCASACGTGEVCYDGACTAACPGGFTDCSGSCRDLDSDRLNCGACDAACAEGEVCDAGACAVTCASPLVDCSGVCSDTRYDPLNCGSCGAACSMGEACVDGSCASVTCILIEDFETGTWPWSPWTAHSGSSGTVGSTFAHDGARGIEDVYWHYRTDVTFGSSTGQTLQWWVRPETATGGRAYLGFASSSSGTRSFVVAFNTNDIRFQNNVSYGYSELSTSSQTYTAGTWYLARVTYDGGGAYTGRLYASDGVTLLNTVTHDYGSPQPGGVAMQTFSGVDADTIILCP
jgi:hypothetical protein